MNIDLSKLAPKLSYDLLSNLIETKTWESVEQLLLFLVNDLDRFNKLSLKNEADTANRLIKTMYQDKLKVIKGIRNKELAPELLDCFMQIQKSIEATIIMEVQGWTLNKTKELIDYSWPSLLCNQYINAFNQVGEAALAFSVKSNLPLNDARLVRFFNIDSELELNEWIMNNFAEFKDDSVCELMKSKVDELISARALLEENLSTFPLAAQIGRASNGYSNTNGKLVSLVSIEEALNFNQKEEDTLKMETKSAGMIKDLWGVLVNTKSTILMQKIIKEHIKECMHKENQGFINYDLSMFLQKELSDPTKEWMLDSIEKMCKDLINQKLQTNSNSDQVLKEVWQVLDQEKYNLLLKTNGVLMLKRVGLLGSAIEGVIEFTFKSTQKDLSINRVVNTLSDVFNEYKKDWWWSIDKQESGVGFALKVNEILNQMSLNEYTDLQCKVLEDKFYIESIHSPTTNNLKIFLALCIKKDLGKELTKMENTILNLLEKNYFQIENAVMKNNDDVSVEPTSLVGDTWLGKFITCKFKSSSAPVLTRSKIQLVKSVLVDKKISEEERIHLLQHIDSDFCKKINEITRRGLDPSFAMRLFDACLDVRSMTRNVEGFKQCIKWLKENDALTYKTMLEESAWVFEGDGTRKKGDLLAYIVAAGDYDTAKWLLDLDPQISTKSTKALVKYLKDRLTNMSSDEPKLRAISAFEQIIFNQIIEKKTEHTVKKVFSL